MRTVLVIAVLVLLMIVAGWLTFTSTNGRTTINVETEKIQQDTTHAIDKTKEAIHGVEENIEKADEPASAP